MEYLPIVPILLFSVIIHEIAHGWMALRLGDSTAKDRGRLTLNPIPHLDPLGSIIIPLLSLASAGTVFIAWAKPVPINPANFRNVRRDDILVSAVGPLSNLVIALACALLYAMVILGFGSVNTMNEGPVRETALFLQKMFAYGISLNVFLAVFNLIPVPPLDGSHVLASLLPPRIAMYYRRIGFAGIVAIIILMRVPFVWGSIVTIVQTVEMPYHALISLLV